MKLKLQDIKTLALSALGGALEFYDFIIFVFFTKTLGELFFPPDIPSWLAELQVYGIFASGYLARPIGGIIMAHFGDIGGRKKMFSFSVFLMALPTLLIGFLPTFETLGILAPLLLLSLRIIQGVAIGGEVPAAWVFVSEHVHEKHVGFACSSLTSGLTAGILLGSLMGSSIYGLLPKNEVLEYGWRIPFILGGVFGFLAVYLRKWLHETPVFEELKKKKEIIKDIPLKAVLKTYKLNVVLSMLVTWMLTSAIVVIILMTPTLVQTYFNIEAEIAFKGSNLSSLALIISCLLSGLFSDRIGKERTILFGGILLTLSSYLLYFDLNKGGENFLLLYTLAGFSVGVVGIVPSIMISAFPANIRFSGLSFSYNMSYAIFGALTPPSISFLTQKWGNFAAPHYIFLSAIFCVLSAFLLKRDVLKNSQNL